MTKTKHTPGPWHIIDHAFPGLNHRNRPIVDDAGDTLCAVRGDGVVNSIRDANARLIAAAPDLLAFARECARADSDCGESIREAARAAIARAEGGAK